MKSRSGRPAGDLPELITFADACHQLGFSRAKGERLVRDPQAGMPLPFKIGSERYFRADDLRKWITRLAEQANGVPAHEATCDVENNSNISLHS